MADIPEGTVKLLDEEENKAIAKRVAIQRVTLEIEEILIREGFTMGDLGEVLDLFNARAHSVFSKQLIKDIKNTYDGLT